MGSEGLVLCEEREFSELFVGENALRDSIEHKTFSPMPHLSVRYAKPGH